MEFLWPLCGQEKNEYSSCDGRIKFAASWLRGQGKCPNCYQIWWNWGYCLVTLWFSFVVDVELNECRVRNKWNRDVEYVELNESRSLSQIRSFWITQSSRTFWRHGFLLSSHALGFGFRTLRSGLNDAPAQALHFQKKFEVITTFHHRDILLQRCLGAKKMPNQSANVDTAIL